MINPEVSEPPGFSLLTPENQYIVFRENSF